jgi:hypothetical protein
VGIRFLRRDLEQLFAETPALRARYRAFAAALIRQTHAICDGMIAAGLIEATQDDLDASQRQQRGCIAAG